MKIPAHRLLAVIISLSAILAVSACRSDHVEITIHNQTGAPLRLLEVDYPSASFGTAALAPGASFHYRIQVQGSGPLTLTYSTTGNPQPHITGPDLAERQHGSLDILLLPDGKAEFHSQFTTNH